MRQTLAVVADFMRRSAKFSDMRSATRWIIKEKKMDLDKQFFSKQIR